MSKCVICRPVDSITINSEMEFVLDDQGGVKIFDNRDQAEQVLRDDGCTDEELRHITFLESCGVCSRCGSPLFKSLLPEYTYQCFSCDEDFYDFEQNPMGGYFAYLDQLRESGVTNMLGAAPYLQEEFPELAGDRARAVEILRTWMRERGRG